mgnify:CR=1 FL=1
MLRVSADWALSRELSGRLPSNSLPPLPPPQPHAQSPINVPQYHVLDGKGSKIATGLQTQVSSQHDTTGQRSAPPCAACARVCACHGAIQLNRLACAPKRACA